MYDLARNEYDKRYAPVKRGTHLASVHRAVVKERRNRSGFYINVDFLILDEGYQSILVPAFFNHYRGEVLDRRFLVLCKAAGLEGWYPELEDLFDDLIGRRVVIEVVHRFRGRKRLERAVDFQPADQDRASTEPLEP